MTMCPCSAQLQPHSKLKGVCPEECVCTCYDCSLFDHADHPCRLRMEDDPSVLHEPSVLGGFDA